MTAALPVGGSHRDLLERVCEYLRDPGVSDAAALDMLAKLCEVAFRDGCTATDQRILDDLRLIEAPPVAGRQ